MSGVREYKSGVRKYKSKKRDPRCSQILNEKLDLYFEKESCSLNDQFRKESGAM